MNEVGGTGLSALAYWPSSVAQFWRHNTYSLFIDVRNIPPLLLDYNGLQLLPFKGSWATRVLLYKLIVGTGAKVAPDWKELSICYPIVFVTLA